MAHPEPPPPNGAMPNTATPNTATPNDGASNHAANEGRPAELRPPIVTVVLVRHGRSTANTAGILAGRTPGVNLDDYGLGQAAAISDRLAGTRFDRLISSPLERCRQTLAPFSASSGLPVEIDDRFAEVDYGDWAGRELKDLGAEPLWRTVQQHPSAAVFPGGEGLAAVSARAAAAIRDIRGSAEHHQTQANQTQQNQTVLVCSHGDVIKSILADALGMHLDAFQRIVVAPASISVIRYTPLRPFVERVNDTGDLGSISPYPTAIQAPEAPPADAANGSNAAVAETSSDAVPGGVVR
jgi:probable phosphomutase (TIGR03848 family)